MNLSGKFSEFLAGWNKASKEKFTGHPLASLFRQDLQNEIESLAIQSNKSFKVKASVGSGGWANVPWISILDPIITTTTQNGVYPVYLFNADGSGFYLSLNQGTTIPSQELGKKVAEERADILKVWLLDQIPELSEWGEKSIDLKAETILGKSYGKANIVAKYYDSSAIPTSKVLIEDLQFLLDIYKKIRELDLENLSHPESNPLDENTVSLPKPFLLLAGNSGTGKTRFVREQVKKTGSLEKTYCLTSVRPDWHEPSDLLGYTSRLSGSTEYAVTDVLQFIVSAWRHLWDTNKLIVCAESFKSQSERLVIKGVSESLKDIPPYWLCLDEMNLAPVEQYFSDYLSVIETREWHWESDSFTYLSDPLLKPSNLKAVHDENNLRKNLGLEDTKYDDLWSLFCQFGIGIPFNLVVAGTVNMDETTHGFSRKVIDRALSFDFGEFFPNDFDYFFESNIQNKTLSYPIHSQAKKADLQGCFDNDGALSIAFLSKVNRVLDKTQFKLAYRALNELLLAVICQNPQTEVELKAVWDDFLMCKLLPRIEGDIDKLGSDSSLLKALNKALKVEFTDFWGKTTRPDLFRENKDKDASPLLITCRCKGKLEWMQERLDTSGFTSFWP